MFYVYILKSTHKNFLYTGFTSNLKRRFKEHDNMEELSTKSSAPFELIHYEAYKNKIDAIRREQYLKTTKGKTTIRTMLKEYFNKGS
jgi:putative endonuclease